MRRTGKKVDKEKIFWKITCGIVVEIDANIRINMWIWLRSPDQLIVQSSFVLVITRSGNYEIKSAFTEMPLRSSWGRPVNSHVIDTLLAFIYYAQSMMQQIPSPMLSSQV